MINRVVLVGRLVRDLESRYTQSNKCVANGTMAVNRKFTNQQGETEADFINIVIWDKSAENAVKYVGKGSLIGIDGRIQVRSYDAQDGTKRWVTEVIAESVKFLEPKRDSKPTQEQFMQEQKPKKKSKQEVMDAFSSFAAEMGIDEDDLPF